VGTVPRPLLKEQIFATGMKSCARHTVRRALKCITKVWKFNILRRLAKPPNPEASNYHRITIHESCMHAFSCPAL